MHGRPRVSYSLRPFAQVRSTLADLPLCPGVHRGDYHIQSQTLDGIRLEQPHRGCEDLLQSS